VQDNNIFNNYMFFFLWSKRKR